MVHKQDYLDSRVNLKQNGITVIICAAITHSALLRKLTCLQVLGLELSIHLSLFAYRGKASWTLHHCRRDYN